jgi:hypothetical protein
VKWTLENVKESSSQAFQDLASWFQQRYYLDSSGNLMAHNYLPLPLPAPAATTLPTTVTPTEVRCLPQMQAMNLPLQLPEPPQMHHYPQIGACLTLLECPSHVLEHLAEVILYDDRSVQQGGGPSRRTRAMVSLLGSAYRLGQTMDQPEEQP